MLTRRRVARLSQRSTNTPASGPMTSTGTAAASSTPLTASGAQVCPLASRTAIHNTSVVLKTKSPTTESVCPKNSRAKLRLMSTPDLDGADAGAGVDDVGCIGLLRAGSQRETAPVDATRTTALRRAGECSHPHRGVPGKASCLFCEAPPYHTTAPCTTADLSSTTSCQWPLPWRPQTCNSAAARHADRVICGLCTRAVLTRTALDAIC